MKTYVVVLLRRQFALMSKPIFWGNKKNILKCLLKIIPSMLSINALANISVFWSINVRAAMIQSSRDSIMTSAYY